MNGSERINPANANGWGCRLNMAPLVYGRKSSDPRRPHREPSDAAELPPACIFS